MAKARGAMRPRSRAAFLNWELKADFSAALYTGRRASLRSMGCLRLRRRDDCVEYFQATVLNRWASGWLQPTLRRVFPNRRKGLLNAARENRSPLENICLWGGCRRV